MRNLFTVLSIFLLSSICFAEDVPFAINWTVEGMHPDEMVRVDAKGRVYARTIGEKELYVLDESGKKQWTYGRPFKQLGTPFISPGGEVYFLVSDYKNIKGYVASLASDGKERWSKKVADNVLRVYWLDHVAGVGDGRVYATTDTHLYGFNENGKLLWTYDYKSIPAWATVSTSKDGKTVYVYLKYKLGVYAFGADGKVKWVKKDLYSNDGGKPVVGVDGNIYIADSYSASLYAFAPDGQQVWKKAFPGKCLHSSVPVVSKSGEIFMHVNNCDAKGGSIHSIDREKGKIKWSVDIESGELNSSVLVDEESASLYYGAGDGYLYNIGLGGKLLRKFNVAGAMGEPSRKVYFSSFPALSGGNLYIVTATQKLISIKVKR